MFQNLSKLNQLWQPNKTYETNLNFRILRIETLNLNSTIIDAFTFQSRKQMLNGPNLVSVFTKRGTQRRFLSEIDRGGN